MTDSDRFDSDRFESDRSDADTDTGPARLCGPFLKSLPIGGVSISVVGESGHHSTVTASDALAARLEAMQFELGEGPHWDALRSGRPALHNDLGAAATRACWPVFGPSAWNAGARALHSFPLFLGALPVGVVDLYSTESGAAWGKTLVETGVDLATAAAPPAVRFATQSADADAPVQQFAPEMRREVHQATGMVLVQLDSTVDVAMSRLRAYAFATDRSLDLVAADVVAGRLDFSELGGQYNS